MAKKSAKGDVNKSQAIRDYLATHKRAKAGAVVTALAEKGIEISPGLVHQVKMKNRTKRGGAKAAMRVPKSKGGLSIENLIAAKKLADAMGGVEQARAALEVLARLG